MGVVRLLSRLARYSAYGVTGLVSLGFAALVVFQRKMVYVPSLPGAPRALYQFKPERFGLTYEELWLVAKDGVRLHAWLCASRHVGLQRGPTVLFFHENAGNISHRLHNVKAMVERLGCNVLIVSYRGYGKSDGTPTEAGLQLDAQAALDYVLQHRELDASRVVLFGRSLGGAVAVALAVKNPGALRGVVLENTFTSIPAMAGCLMPVLARLVGPGKPLSFLVQDKWETEGRIGAVVAPVLFISSGQDEMVPPSHMRALWARRASPRSVWLDLPEAHHMDAWVSGGDAYWQGIHSFLQALGCYAAEAAAARAQQVAAQ